MAGVEGDLRAYSGEDYHDKFSAHDYFTSYYDAKLDRGSSSNNLRAVYESLRFFHEAFKSLPSGLRILEYGTGPILAYVISAASKASEIVLSDYSEENRATLREWLTGEACSFDWSPYFSYVVNELEGEVGEEGAVKKRQEAVRRLVSAVVHCDLTQDPPIQKEYAKQYDVVISSLCIEAVAETKEDYKRGVKKLSELVKPGGCLLLSTCELKSGPSVYTVGDAKFKAFGVPPSFVEDAMKEEGFSDIYFEKVFTAPEMAETVWWHYIFRGTKLPAYN